MLFLEFYWKQFAARCIFRPSANFQEYVFVILDLEHFGDNDVRLRLTVEGD